MTKRTGGFWLDYLTRFLLQEGLGVRHYLGMEENEEPALSKLIRYQWWRFLAKLIW